MLFPPWHRPYLSLYEKTLLDLATNIVNTFPAGTVKNQHLASLQTWRIPYWDWAKNGSIPSVINANTNVVVTTVQNGVLKNVTIHNPLYSYPTNPKDPNTKVAGNSNSGPFTEQTVRNPTVQQNVYVSQSTVTNNKMIQARPGLKTAVYQALSISTDYNSFSNTVDGTYSIEGPHGTIHGTVGGKNGHMSYVSSAAFDPIFFLHHANIDRFIALWQAIYPNSYVSNQTTAFPNQDTALNPFRQTDTQYWTSKLARNVTAFGYTYPELVNCNQQCVIAVVNKLYSPNSSKKKRDVATASATYNEYAAHINISNGAANGSFSVNIFLGEPSSNESDYSTDPNYVGSFDVFTHRNIPKAHKKMVKGAVSMTTALYQLVDAGTLKDMTLKTVKQYVKDNFKWIITGENSGDYDLDGLGIAVVTAEVKLPKDEYALPVWGKFSTVYKVV